MTKNMTAEKNLISGDLYKNPFSEYNANVMEPDAILEYWCSPFRFMQFARIKEADIYLEKMPIVFMGGRGTGKTMFLKYFSFSVQIKKALSERDKKRPILNHFIDKGGIGFYIRIDGPVLRSFEGYGLSDETWNSIFIHYFEIIVARSYIEILHELIKHNELDETQLNDKFLPAMAELLGTSKNNMNSINDILADIDIKIREVTTFRGEIPHKDIKFKPSKGYSSGSLSLEIPQIIKNTIREFEKGIHFVLMIDEFENFLSAQQIMVNTLMKFVRCEVTFRIGMRLEGFRTFETISKEDFIKDGRDYQKIVFEEVLNIKDKGYQNFLENIARKRLERVKIFKEKGFLDIRNILQRSEKLEEEAVNLVRKYPEKHFDLVKGQISSKDIHLLKSKGNPLMEMLNILWFFRKKDLITINKAMNDYLDHRQTDLARKYKMDYTDKYKLSLMFLLSSLYRSNKMYYSFNTFSYLSSGIIGHFIELCRRSFQYAEFENREVLFNDGKILPIQQDKAAKEVAATELQNIQRIEDFGDYLYNFVIGMGNIFRDFHKDKTIKYPETNQFTLEKASQDEPLRQALNAGLKWSVIQKKPTLQQPAPGKHVKDIYTLNRIYSPIFEISYRIRGGYSVDIDPELLRKLMKGEQGEYGGKRKKTLSIEKENDKPEPQQSFEF